MKKSHVGLGVILIMSLKGTATLLGAMLLPTWPLRIIALHIIVIIAVIVIIRHRRKRKYLLHEGNEGFKGNEGV